MPQLICLVLVLSLMPACFAEPSQPTNIVGIDQLPLVELRAARDYRNEFAIILSGDGGWADLDRDFGNAFQRHGLSTVGFDCLKYFWTPRRPAEVTQALEATIRHYMKIWQKEQVLLVGYSFGADWLPFLINRLPADLQHRVVLVTLLAPGASVNVEIKAEDWMHDIERPGALQVASEAAHIRLPLLCVYGAEEEQKSICPGLKGANVQRLRMPGGHHFNNRYAPIEDAILQGIQSGNHTGPAVPTE